MKNIKYKEFSEAIKRLHDNLSEVLSDKEKSVINNLYAEYFGQDYLQTVNYDFEKYRLLGDFSIECSFYFVEVPAIEKVVFRDNSFTHVDFYDIAYYFNCMALCTKYLTKFIEYFKYFIELINSLSLTKLLNLNQSIYSNDISEAELFDRFIKMSIRDVTTIIERVNTSKENKNSLKYSILNKDEDLFIETIIKERINFDNVIIAIQYNNYYKQIIETLQFINILCDSGSKHSDINALWSQTLDFIFRDESIVLDEKEYNTILQCHQLVKDYGESPSPIPNLDYNFLYRKLTNLDAILLHTFQLIRKASLNIELISEIEELIKNSSYFKNLNEMIISGEVDPNEYELTIKPLEDFRDKFIEQLVLPENIKTSNNKKDARSFIATFRSIDISFCRRIYETLVKAKLFLYDNDTFYSFMYRMGHEYMGSTEPKPIVWLGEARELYNLIFWFCNGGETQIWKKTAEFFIMANGNKLKTNGVKNQAQRKSKKMKAVIAELEKL